MNAPSACFEPIETKSTSYRHLETDVEFRSRLSAAGHAVVSCKPAGALPGESEYKHFTRTRWIGETEYAWAKRMATPTLHALSVLAGDELDDKVWEGLKMQRRIIMVAP